MQVIVTSITTAGAVLGANQGHRLMQDRKRRKNGEEETTKYVIVEHCRFEHQRLAEVNKEARELAKELASQVTQISQAVAVLVDRAKRGE